MSIESRDVRNERLHQECPAGLEMRSDVAEASHLFVLGEQREERVEDDEDQTEVALNRHVGQIAHVDGDGIAARLRAKLVDDRLRDVDAVDLHPPLGERQRDTTGTDAELEGVSVAGEIGEEGESLDGAFELQGVVLVVDLGDPVTVGGARVVIHR